MAERRKNISQSGSSAELALNDEDMGKSQILTKQPVPVISQMAIEHFNVFLLCAGAVLLIPYGMKVPAWIVLGSGAFGLFFCRKDFMKDVSLLYGSIFILGFVPITTNLSYTHFAEMGSMLLVVLFMPFLVSRVIYRNNHVGFKFHNGRYWTRTEIGYILVTAVIAYLVLPFFLKNTGSYRNWSVEPNIDSLIRLFLGTNGLGIWDELFFISTVLGILRRYMNFHVANVAQGIMFSAFLFELGFRGWGFAMIFIFALIQGYVFRKTESLFYVITIHLTLDLILYLALINAHIPGWLPIFLK